MAKGGACAWEQAFLTRHQLPASYFNVAQKWFEPLLQQIAVHQGSANRAILVGVNGCQGSGKTTLCDYLTLRLAVDYGLQVVSLSLDDFYLSRYQRQQLAQRVHPLFVTRGVPGTHDMNLLAATLEDLLSGGLPRLPRFDKAQDEPLLPAGWASPRQPVDIVLLEGWCWGARPQQPAQLATPCNTLEALGDADGVWRNFSNAVLAEAFVPLYERVDYWVMLAAPSFDAVLQWRSEQESKLTTPGPGVMNAQQIAYFIAHFQRLTEHCLATLPRQVNALFEYSVQRNILSSHGLQVAL